MKKVKCCHNCKYCHMAKSSPMFCVVKGVVVEPDTKCRNHLPTDVLTEYEEENE